MMVRKCDIHTDCQMIYHPAVYDPIPAEQVPSGLTWDMDGRDRGQIVEVSYGAFGASAGAGDLYQMTLDRSERHPLAQFAKRTTVWYWEHRRAQR